MIFVLEIKQHFKYCDISNNFNIAISKYCDILDIVIFKNCDILNIVILILEQEILMTRIVQGQHVDARRETD